jgi:hypothetical protein
MAGDWLKWQKGLAKKPEVMQLAAILNRSRHEMAGLLMELWEWADDNVVFDVRVLSGSEPDTCPGVVRLGADAKHLLDAVSDVTGLADAMMRVGWLTIDGESLVFPNFGRHNGKSAKARALDTSRKKSARANDGKPVRQMSGSKPDKNRTREEKRREENNTPLIPHRGNLEPPPSSADGVTAKSPTKRKPKPAAEPEGFAEFWAAYPKKVAKPAAAKAFAKLAPSPELLATILAAIAKQARSEQWTKDGGQFVPHPASWLNQQRWLDEMKAQAPPQATPPAPRKQPTADELKAAGLI